VTCAIEGILQYQSDRRIVIDVQDRRHVQGLGPLKEFGREPDTPKG
jgi:hypothetical protein